MRKVFCFWIIATFTSVALAGDTKPALASITTNDLLKHIQVLASDEFEGRAPGSPGEQRTLDYLVRQFKAIGLQPGNPNGTFFQNVPLVGISSDPSATLTAASKPLEVFLPRDLVLWSRHLEPEVKVTDTDVVFVGYGIVAPEYQWDDFKGADVRGKTVLMLVNDPPIPDPNDPSKLDDKMFKGRGMTYYGRWTYKYEIASAKGAAAAIIVHETGPAGYPWAVVVGSNSRENMDLKSANANKDRVPVEGWCTVDTAIKWCKAAGKDYEALKKQARGRDFRPVPLNAKASFKVANRWREIESSNVVAKLEGSDSKLKNDVVIYTAHWDHLGKNAAGSGDQIYNGALDNASGTAALLELAQAFTKAPPKATVLFLAVTAEEKGLLGAKYYATHPLYPLARTLANINIDGVNVWGRTRDLGLVGVGQSTLEDILKKFVQAQGRVLLPEAEPEKGYYYRSDHFEFAKVGVPALYVDEGVEFTGKAKDFGLKKRAEYIANDYHKPSDEIKPDWDLSGAVADIRLLFQVGHAVAQGEARPEWKAGSEFKNKRR